MISDYYETNDERTSLLAEGKVPIGIGARSVLKNCIADKNARIGRDCVLVNKDNVQQSDEYAHLGIYIRSGIIVIRRNATVPNGTTL